MRVVERKHFWPVLAGGLLLPTVITWIYFDLLHATPAAIQQGAYGLLKTIQFTLPLAIFFGLAWRPKGSRRITARDLTLGVLFGIFACAAMIAVYGTLLAGSAHDTALRGMAVEKIEGLGIDRVWKYAALGLFYALIHSFLEEYYWRWFVFGWCAQRWTLWWSVGLSSLGFMLHHVLVLGYFFGWAAWPTWVCSAGVALGGAFWAWLFHRTGNLTAPWISHALVDAGIFGLGYWLIRSHWSIESAAAVF